MTRYTITVPLRDNNRQHQTYVVETVRDSLARTFDGYTELAASGGWFAGTHPATEPISVFVIDTDDDRALLKLRTLAHYVKRELEQDAVYLTHHPINVELI